jgi:very-short-patch-repair endonuclease
VTFDPDRIVDRLLEVFVGEGNNWLTFRQLAHRITGDSSKEYMIAGVVHQYEKVFVIHNDRSCKLRAEFIEGAAKVEPPAQEPPEPLYIEAARAVREYARQLRSLHIKIVGADQGKRVLDRFLHALQVELLDDDIRFSDDTPVELVSAHGSRNPGHIAGASRDEALLYVAFEFEILPVDLPGWLEVSRSQAFLNLAEYLASLKTPPPLAVALNSGSLQTTPLQDQDSEVVARGLQQTDTPWARLLWGPPGAGKTYCSARLATALLTHSADERVLVVAPSNVAVDAALAELINALECSEEGKRLLTDRLVLRYGYPRDERINSRPELFGPAGLENLSREVHTVQLEVRRLTQKRSPEPEIAEAKTRLRQLQSQRKTRISEHVAGARVVATTVTSAFTGNSPLLKGTGWQTVIADEASMLAGASVLALAALARQRLLLVGDPRQLGPIFEWNAPGTASPNVQRWLASDPYETASLSVGTGWGKRIRTDDSRMAQIIAQRRCHPRIWSLVQLLYPAVNTLTDIARISQLADIPPLPGEPAVLLDLSRARSLRHEIPSTESSEDLKVNWESACRKVGQSWENPPTAMLAIDAARDARSRRPDASIAIIAPYRGQVNLIRRWLHQERQVDSKLRGIEVGTVHAFQGGEADIVIFDMVDGPPRSQPGLLFRDDTGMRLVNVAVTRARGKLIFIAHKDWVYESEPTKLGLLWNILFGTSAKPPVCTVVPPAYHRSDSGDYGGRPESPIEELLFSELCRWQRQLPAFRLQHRITNEDGRIVSRADVAFTGPKLAVFCDGARYHLEPRQWQRDLKQRRELTRLGWRVLAFTGSEITADVSGCVNQVLAILTRGRQAG